MSPVVKWKKQWLDIVRTAEYVQLQLQQVNKDITEQVKVTVFTIRFVMHVDISNQLYE